MEPRKLVDEFVIPKCSSKAFLLKKGQVLRVIAHEAKQVADIRFINAHDYREQVASYYSIGLNSIEGIGGNKKIKKLYSKPPLAKCNADCDRRQSGEASNGCPVYAEVLRTGGEARSSQLQ